MKEFDRWNEQKKKTDARDDRVLFHEREIWWCSLGVNVGSEQDGVGKRFERPVLVVKNFNGKVAWVIPLSRTFKKGSPYYRLLDETDAGKSAVVLTQLRLISIKRLVRKMDTIGEWQFREIVRGIRSLFPNI